MNKNKHFHLFLMLMLTNPVFFLYKVKIPCEQFLIFLNFMNKFSEDADRTCSSKIVLLKIS